ncbi:MAG: Gfo/Idh/MocA family oxidoreductase [Sedimentisphaerales bacterium]|nr:Gfo/Idh/MocA family oxidoreductase [Sedimentisphaerales bacterium]
MNARGINRRQFLKQAAGTSAAAVGFPYLVASSAMGNAGEVAPSNRIVMGAIGVGGQGTRHVGGGIWVQGGGFLSKPVVQFVAICDVNANHRNRGVEIVNKHYGNKDCASYNDFRELTARKDIDAVLVATPDHWHVLTSIAAVKAGMDVYCEKPMSLTIRQAREMADTVKRYGRIFQTGTQQRSWREFRVACELIRNGYIGRVKSITVNVGGPPAWSCNAPGEPEPEWLDWNMWLGPAPWRTYTSKIAPGGWMGYRDYSGGEMTNWGAHMFDTAQWAMGADESGPVEIIPPDGKDYKVLTYKYANGTIMTRGPISRNVPGVRFEGTEGMIEVSRDHLIAEPESLLRQQIGRDEIHLYESINHPDNFLECIKSRKRPASDAEVGCRSITVCHLGNIAYWLKRPLRWNPEGEHFINDPEADKMRARALRAPWRL